MSKHMIVLGGGESGVGAALLGHQLGYIVFVSDNGSKETSLQKEKDYHNIHREQHKHTTAQILKADLVIKSPGISSDTPIVEALRSVEIPLLSEIEFASLHTDAELIGITGTNGKTTTAMLTHHLLASAGKSVALAGNIGDSFAKAITINSPDYWVLELSSFQLEDIQISLCHFL